jgi:predicted nucleotidyltransferase component of viral defense system
MDEMIADRILRRIARERKLRLDLIEKDYASGWILNGITASSSRNKLIFKGGTALSKVYFPFNWRISEDLDFTLSKNAKLEDISTNLLDELPGIVEEASGGITLNFKDRPFINPGFLRARAQFTGPISKNTIKIEVTKEKFIGENDTIDVPRTYDYPEFSVLSYTLNNILAEKLRSMIERTRIRDYYDSWRLLKIDAVDDERVKELFIKKCEAKNIKFQDVNTFFPDNLMETLEPHLDTLTRLTVEPLPPLRQIIDELKKNLEKKF